MKNANIAIFIPHNGCKNQCSFCNQKNITGVKTQPTPDEVKKILEKAKNDLKSKKNKKFSKVQIAFFGGSFTAIDRDYMISLLKVASKFLDGDIFDGIRVSTRPDKIDDEIIDILKYYGVKTVELGAQSMIDEVLLCNNRGHTSKSVKIASEKIKNAGLKLGLQMMTGLYKSNFQKDKKTALEFIKLKPDMVRIYPTVVLRGTDLERLYKEGKYIPMSFEETVNLCSELLRLFERENNIPVIRLGLHDSESLRQNMIVGVFHPAFREICESRVFYLDALKKIKKIENNRNQKLSNVSFKLNPRDLSKFCGQKKENIKKFRDLGYDIKILQDEKINLENFEILV